MPKKFFPEFVIPMTASVAKKPFNDPDWIFETKLDGYRAMRSLIQLARLGSGLAIDCHLSLSSPTIRDSIEELKLRSTILDGEIVALDAEGIPRFQLLQQWQKRPTAPVCFYLFDLLWSEGRDFTMERNVYEHHPGTLNTQVT